MLGEVDCAKSKPIQTTRFTGKRYVDFLQRAIPIDLRDQRSHAIGDLLNDVGATEVLREIVAFG